MEQEKNVKKIGTMGLMITIFITVIVTTVFIIGIYFLVLKTKENNKNPAIENDLNNLSYDIIVSDWSRKNENIEGGFAFVFGATLVNSNKKEMYTISYSDVWEIHEQSGSKDSVTVEIRKMSDKKLSNIINKYKTQKVSTIKDFLNKHIESDYDFKISYQSIDNIKYDIIVNKKITNIEEDLGNKTKDGVYAIEHYYELVNSQSKKKYRVYCDDVAEIYNVAGEEDFLIVEIEQITDEELKQIITSKNKSATLQNLYDLLEGQITDEYIIYVNEY